MSRLTKIPKKAFSLPARYFVKPGPPNPNAFGRWIYNTGTFRRYGLHYHDTWGSYRVPAFSSLFKDVDYNDQPHIDPVLAEAVRRLPPSIKDPRNERGYLASELYYRQKYLPVAQWTKYEEDHRYLTPFIEEVEREFAEKARYENTDELW